MNYIILNRQNLVVYGSQVCDCSLFYTARSSALAQLGLTSKPAWWCFFLSFWRRDTYPTNLCRLEAEAFNSIIHKW